MSKEKLYRLNDFNGFYLEVKEGKPENVRSLGDIEKAANVFVRNELIPME